MACSHYSRDFTIAHALHEQILRFGDSLRPFSFLFVCSLLWPMLF